MPAKPRSGDLQLLPQAAVAVAGQDHHATRVLYGDRTYPFVAKSVARWCSLNPQVSAHAVVGGHCFMQEDPADAAERVRDFLLPNP